MGIKDAGKSLSKAIIHNEQLIVVKPKQVEDGCVPVGDADRVFHGGEADLICGAICGTGFYPRPRHPGGKGVFVVVPARFAFVFVRGQLGDGEPAKFSTPDHQSTIEKAPLF